MAKEEKKPIDRETKAMILSVLKRGYFQKADFDLLAQKYDYEPNEEELTGSIPIEDWIRWRVKENSKNSTTHGSNEN